jgi:thioredoxin-related protein
MKKFFTFAMFLSILAILASSVSAEEIRWFSFNKGMEIAQKHKKPVVVDFYADWCHWCQVMAKTTFKNPEIIKKMNNEYVAIKIDTQKNESITYRGVRYSSIGFAQAIGVEGLPTVLFLDKKGAIITRLGGYIRANTFLAILDYIKDECYRDQIAFADYMKGKKHCRGSQK